MKIPYELISELEDIHFKYERLEAMISLLQAVAAEVAEVRGISQKSLDYSLYEIDLNMISNNERLKDFTSKLLREDDEKAVQL